MLSPKVGEKVPAYAEIIHEAFSFSGGVNKRSSLLFLSKDQLYSLQPDQLLNADNVIRTKSGELETRPGRVKVNSVAVSPPSGDAVIRSIAELRRSDGVNSICINAGNTFYELVASTWTSRGTVSTANLRMSYAQFKEALFGVDGTNDMIKWDGTALSSIAAAPKGTCLAAHRNRLWIIKNKSLHYSALGDETDWTTPNNAGVLPIPITSGAQGSALFPLWDRLLVYSKGQIFQLFGTGPLDFQIVAVSVVYGHEASCYGVVAGGNEVYCADARGVHAMSITEAQSVTGDVSYRYASGRIEPEWQRVTSGNLPNVFALHDKQRNLILFFHSTGSNNNDSCWVADYYHLDQQGQPTWTRYANMPFACGTEVKSISGLPELLFGSYDGFVYRQTNANNDDGAVIPIGLQYITAMDLPQFEKLLRHLLVFTNATSGTLIISANYDFGQRIVSQSFDIANLGGAVLGSTFVIGESPLGDVSYKQTKYSLPGHGRWFTLNFNFSADARFRLGGFMMFAGARRVIHT